MFHLAYFSLESLLERQLYLVWGQLFQLNERMSTIEVRTLDLSVHMSSL